MNDVCNIIYMTHNDVCNIIYITHVPASHLLAIASNLAADAVVKSGLRNLNLETETLSLWTDTDEEDLTIKQPYGAALC